MQTCKTCKHFALRYNSHTLGYCYSSKIVNHEPEEEEKTINSLFHFVEEGCGCSCLEVGIDFGCIHYELKS